MINSETNSNDDQKSSSEINNNSTNLNIENQNDEFLSNNTCKETTNKMHQGKVPKPDDERKLFVGQLSPDITKEDLEKYFSKFGLIEDVTIKYDVPGGRTRGFAFILFDNKDSIQKVLDTRIHKINQCQIDPKPANRRPPVTNPVKKIFIGQLPTDFVEHDLSDYFSQFGIVDTIELPMDREKSVRRPFGFVSFSSEKSAEEVLRQQRHSINGASIEVRPAKPRPHEQHHHHHHQQQHHHHHHHQQHQQQQHQQQQQQQQQQFHIQQQYHYGDFFVPQHQNNALIPTMSAPPITHPTMIAVSHNQNAFYSQTATNNYVGQAEQWSQGMNNGTPYWNGANGDIRNNNNTTSVAQWSTGSNGGLPTISGNNSIYGQLGNSASSSSAIYPQNPGQSIYNPNHPNSYPHPNYPNQLQSSYGLSSSQSTGNIYASGYPSSTLIQPADLQSATWNQYASSNNPNQTNYDQNMYYASYYPNVVGQQYLPPQVMNQSQAPISVEQTMSPNGFPASSNGGLDKNYQHLSR